MHPRPHLERSRWVPIDGEWEFAFDDDDAGLDERWWEQTAPFDRRIRVPFAPETAASGIGERGVHPVAWYARCVSRAELTGAGPGERLMLHFGAVDHEAQVWVNGRFLGGHRGGSTPFEFDVTAAIGADDAASMRIVVRAFDDSRDGTLPRGKQDWRADPHEIWYDRTTGIWRGVWLERVPALRIESLHVTSDIAAGTIRADVRLSRPPRSAAILRLSISLGSEVLSLISTSVDDRRVTLVAAPTALRHGEDRQQFLWRPENPVLLDVGCDLLVEDVLQDAVTRRHGHRSIEVDRGRMLLNGLPIELRAVLAQGYWPDTGFTAPDEVALKREVELALSMGFNAVRIHQKVEDPRFLAWADQLGLMVWVEGPSAYEFSQDAVARATAEWTEIVEVSRAYACVIVWVPLNESWGLRDAARSRAQQEFARGMASVTRALDPTRPVISNDGWEHVDSDLTTVHDYAADGATLLQRYGDAAAIERTLAGMGPQGRRLAVDAHQLERLRSGSAPLVLSEFGGIALAARDDGQWGYSVSADEADLQSRLEDLFSALRLIPSLAGWCYTQLTDTAQEVNGLLTADRRPKVAPEVIRAIVLGHIVPVAVASPAPS